MQRVKFKPGVVWVDMDPRLEAALPRAARAWEAATGAPPTITSARDGEHSPNSLHYEGRAYDLRTRHLTREKIEAGAAALRRELGPDYDIVIEADHVHVELDRRADRRLLAPEPQLGTHLPDPATEV